MVCTCGILNLAEWKEREGQREREAKAFGLTWVKDWIWREDSPSWMSLSSNIDRMLSDSSSEEAEEGEREGVGFELFDYFGMGSRDRGGGLT